MGEYDSSLAGLKLVDELIASDSEHETPHGADARWESDELTAVNVDGFLPAPRYKSAAKGRYQ